MARAKRILLEKGQDPLKMEFTESRPNPVSGCIIGLLLLLVGACCIGGGLLATGIIQWPLA